MKCALNKGRITAVVGMCGAGKSEVTKVFLEEGYEKVYFGGVTMDVLEKRGLEKNEQNERSVREELRKTYGPAAFAILLVDKIRDLSEKGNVVLDGLYSWSEYKILKEEFPELTLLCVTVDKELRYERLAKRPIRPLTKEQARSRDLSEIENIEKGGPIAFADVTLSNNGTLEELYEKVRGFIKG
ncbi:MAG: dephospho-CoA kinase [Ruminococcaceae bacterium]|nr:dephospho-CoA kinase [Oscillospiraceae bacterium]